MAESSKEIEEELRKKFTEDRDPSERRMDSLSRLLSGRTTCLGISLVNGMIYIAANEFFSGTIVRFWGKMDASCYIS